MNQQIDDQSGDEQLQKYSEGGNLAQLSRPSYQAQEKQGPIQEEAKSQHTMHSTKAESSNNNSSVATRAKSATTSQASHQYSAHYTGSSTVEEGTRQRRPQEMSALDRLKLIQQNFKQTWNGIQCESTGRPGTSNFVNKKRAVTVIESAVQEDERQKQLFKIFQKLKEIEDERTSTANGTQRTSVSGLSQGFHSSASQTAGSQGFYNANNKNTSEFLVFKNTAIEKGVGSNSNFQANSYGKNYHIENSELLVKFVRFENRMVRSILENHQFTQTESHEWNLLWSSGSCKSYQYEGLNEFQKINKFPYSNEITRKDRMCFNIVRMQEKFGRQAFDLAPDTYILPDEFGDFYNHYQKLKQHESKKNVWIIKPANSCQGKGIYLIDDINDVNVDETSVISKYITNPLLINGHKFDLRIYVCITSYEPLRVYVHQEGLARFASETYTQKINKQNKYMHLTNYSINKKNDKFIANENCEQDDFGYKWSLGAFCKHLEQVGIDMNLLWSRIYDLIIKTLLCSENYVQTNMKKYGCHRTNCYELLGFDVLIDSDLKPWLLEVNISSSMATDAPLDMMIKSTLCVDTFNLIGIKKYDRKKESMNKMKNRMKGMYNKPPQTASGLGMKKTNGLTSGIQGTAINPQQANSDFISGQSNMQTIQALERLVVENPAEMQPVFEPLKKALNCRYREYIRETLAEYQRRGNYVRIYPAKGSDIYDQYFLGPRPYNKAVYKALFTDEILLVQKQSIPPQIKTQEQKNKQQQSQSAYENYKKQQMEKAELKKQEEQSNLKKQMQTTENSEKQTRPEQSHQPMRAQSSKPETQMNNFLESETSSQLKEATSSVTTNVKDQERVLITGDDILIEYVDRLMREIKDVSDQDLKPNWKVQIEKFITHYVWHSQDAIQTEKIKQGQRYSTPFWVRLQVRLTEMQERRRRLIKYLYKKEGKLEEFEEGFLQSIQKKTQIIKKFSSIQLEDLLRTSTKNVAQEVVSSLIPAQGGLGVLADVQQSDIHLNNSNRRPERVTSADHLSGAGLSANTRRNQSSTNSAQRLNANSNQQLAQAQNYPRGMGNDNLVRQVKTASGTRPPIKMPFNSSNAFLQNDDNKFI